MGKWIIEEMTGYKPITTFWDDFSIADKFGTDAVKDTYNKAFNGWKHDYKYITELVMVLNWKSWEQYKANNKELMELYNDLYEELDNWCFDNLEEHELQYFIKVTD